jgi:hypothetical protein
MFVALSLLALCASVDPTAAAAGTTSGAAGVPLAALPLRAEGLQLNEAQRLDALVREQSASVGGYRVQGAEDTISLLEAAQALGITCDVSTPECGAQIGAVAAVERVVVGRAVRVATSPEHQGGVGLELVLVDVKSRTVLRRVLSLLPDDPAAQVDAFPRATRVLFGADGAAPWLVVNGGAPGARLTVDGIDVGALPLQRPLAGIVGGAHVVRVVAPGFLPWAKLVQTAGIEPTVVDVALVVDPTAVREVVSPEQITLAWTVAGVGAALFAAGGVVAGVASQPWFVFTDAEQKLKALQPSDEDYAQKAVLLHDRAAQAEQDWATASQWTVAGLFGVGVGVVAGVGGAIWGTVLMQTYEPSSPGKDASGSTAPATTSTTSPTTTTTSAR